MRPAADPDRSASKLRALHKWIVEHGIDTALIDPGKPWQNGAAENFNGEFRDGCLSLEWFRSRAEARW